MQRSRRHKREKKIQKGKYGIRQYDDPNTTITKINVTRVNLSIKGQTLFFWIIKINPPKCCIHMILLKQEGTGGLEIKE